MVIRSGAFTVLRATAIAGTVLFASCDAPAMDRDEVASVSSDALRSAGIAAEAVEVAAVPADGLWTVTATIDGSSVELLVSGTEGRVTSIDIPAGQDLTDAQLDALARYEDNPHAHGAEVRRAVIIVSALVVATAGGLLLARRARLREEATTGTPT